MSQERHIVHLDLDTFFVSVERLRHRELAGKPVLIGGFSNRAVVASCSYEARKFGIHSAMSMRLARQLCPQAIVIRGDHEAYSRFSRMVTEIIEEQTPVVEKASIDEHYLDISGMDRFFGCWKWTRELRQKIIKETRLPISFGLSVNKTVSKIATGEAKPFGERLVSDGMEKAFLAPLPIRKIPMVGPKYAMQLRNMGIRKIHTLQEMDPHLIQQVLGKNGAAIWKKANGIDRTPVLPYSKQKSMSKEETFEKDTINMLRLKKVLARMVDGLAFELRKEGKVTGCVSLKIRYSNFETFSRQQKIAYTCSDKILLGKILDLFRKLYSRRMLIRLIGVRLSDLVTGGYQMDLFHDVAADLHLMEAMDGIRARFGVEKISRGICFKEKEEEECY